MRKSVDKNKKINYTINNLIKNQKEDFIMATAAILFGVIWIIYQLYKDASIQDVTRGGKYDWMSATIDSGRLDRKEFQRREKNGYYTKK